MALLLANEEQKAEVSHIHRFLSRGGDSNMGRRRRSVSMVKNGIATQRRNAAATYSSTISTDIPLYELPGASFDQYLEDKPRVFQAIFPDKKRRSQRLNEEEWSVHVLPKDFLFLTVRPVVDMRLKCKSSGTDYPPGVPPDISKVLDLKIIKWELQGFDVS